MPSAYDFRIDCAQDKTFNIYVERQGSADGTYEAYTPITGVTMLLSATRGGSTPIHANLSKSAEERSGNPGWIFCVMDVTDLQTYLKVGPPSYVGATIFLNVFKSGELQYEPFRCLVVADRL